MNKSHWILFTVVAGFTGFLLGYSVPPIIEISTGDSVDDVTIENMDSEEVSDYYKELQDLK